MLVTTPLPCFHSPSFPPLPHDSSLSLSIFLSLSHRPSLHHYQAHDSAFFMVLFASVLVCIYLLIDSLVCFTCLIHLLSFTCLLHYLLVSPAHKIGSHVKPRPTFTLTFQVSHYPLPLHLLPSLIPSFPPSLPHPLLPSLIPSFPPAASQPRNIFSNSDIKLDNLGDPPSPSIRLFIIKILR